MLKSKNFSGQPIFSQVLQLIPRELIIRLVRQYKSDHYVKKFKTYDQLVSMLFCVYQQCGSLREVSTGMQVWHGRLRHLGLGSYPCRSTLAEANKRCPEALFGDLYHQLVRLYYAQLSPDSRIRRTIQERLYLIDSTTIELFNDVMKGAGIGKRDGRRKGGVKVHTLVSAAHNIPSIVYLTQAKENDRVFMEKVKVPAGSILVFDKGYSKYSQWQTWNDKGLYWVTRLSKVAYYEVQEEREVNATQSEMGVIEDQMVLLGRGTGPGSVRIRARRIRYYDAEKKRHFEFVTNHTRLSASNIADLYRRRWQIETLFKSVKQNYQLRYFLGDNPNAICIQIWCSLIADLLVKVIQRSVKKRPWSLANLTSLIRMHLGTYVHLFAFLQNPHLALKNVLSVDQKQTAIFFNTG